MFHEVVKQVIDQSAHAAIGLMAGVLVGRGLATDSFLSTMVGIGIVFIMAVREYAQWPSSRWYDPYLDWTILVSALVVGLGLGVRG